MGKYGKGLTNFLYNMFSLCVVMVCGICCPTGRILLISPGFRDLGSFVALVREGDIEGVFPKRAYLGQPAAHLRRFRRGCAIGIPLGLAMGLWPKLYYRTRAIIEPIRFIPPLAWIPIAIVFMVGFNRYVFLIWLGAFFPIFITTLLSVTRVNPVHVNVAKVFGASRSYIIRKIVVPSVLPDIATGMRVGLGVA